MDTERIASNLENENTKTDIELWDSFRAGHKAALFELYKRMYIPLVNYGVRICRDMELACDGFSDFMILLWDKRNQLNEVKNVKSYLMTSLRRQLIADLKFQDRFTSVSGSENEAFEPYESLLEALENQEVVKKRLQAAFSKLSPRQAQFIRMRFYDGMSYEEISEASGVHIKAVYNKVHEGIKILRQHLPPEQRNIPVFLLIFLLLGSAFAS